MPNHEVVICTYRVKPGCEAAFEKLLKVHWPTLHAQGLVTDTPARHYKKVPSRKPGAVATRGTEYRETLSWKNDEAPHKAHNSAAVMAVWEPMGELCEGWDGLPSMEFPSFQELHILPVGAKKAAAKPGRKPAKKAAKKPAKRAAKKRTGSSGKRR
jgi:hypothetical protein